MSAPVKKEEGPFDFKYVTLDTEQGDDKLGLPVVKPADDRVGKLAGANPDPSLGRGYGCLVSIGFNVRDMKTKEVVERWGKVFPFNDSDFGRRCFEEFWDNEIKNPGIRAMLVKCKAERDRLIKSTQDKLEAQNPEQSFTPEEISAVAIYDVCREVADKIDEWDLALKPWYLTDFGSYDGGALSAVCAIAGRPHIGYMCTGVNEDGSKKYDFKRIDMHSTSFFRSICSESFGKMWGSEQNAMDKYEIKKPKHIVHDHDPINDAESISWKFCEIYHAHYAHLQKAEACYHCITPDRYYDLAQHLRRIVLDRVRAGWEEPLKIVPFPSEEIKSEFIGMNVGLDEELEQDIQAFAKKMKKHIRVGSKRALDIVSGFAMGSEFAVQKLQKTSQLDDVAVAEIRKLQGPHQF